MRIYGNDTGQAFPELQGDIWGQVQNTIAKHGTIQGMFVPQKGDESNGTKNKQ
jgi:hypothetical protein